MKMAVAVPSTCHCKRQEAGMRERIVLARQVALLRVNNRTTDNNTASIHTLPHAHNQKWLLTHHEMWTKNQMLECKASYTASFTYS
jgi:hypothetical protein